MLLKLGTGMMIFAVAFAVVVAIAVNLSDADEPAASETAVELRAAETPTVQQEEFDVDEKLELDIEPRKEPREPQATETPVQENEPVIQEKVETEEQPPPKPPEEPPATPREEPSAKPPEDPPEDPPVKLDERPEDDTLPALSEDDWPQPSREEVAAASRPRHYPWREDAVFTLTIAALEIYNAPVLDSTSVQALSAGVVHVPETPMPWDEGQQKNVYLAGHRIGLPGTNSRVLFYHLDKISIGDSVVLKDRWGNAYRYRVSEIFVVTPDAGWVLDPVRNRDMLTLQTCTYPTFENRLIVRADRV